MPIQIRPIARAEVPAWSDLIARIAAADGTGDLYSAEDLHEELDNPAGAGEEDVLVAVDGSDLVGWAQLTRVDGSEGVHKAYLDGGTDPDRRGEGIGTALLTALLDHVGGVHASLPAGTAREWYLHVLADDAAACDLAERAGFAVDRYSVDMRAVLADLDPQPAQEVAGLAVVPYREELDAAVLDAHNDAFRDHPGSSRWSAAQWRHFVTSSRAFRPGLSVLAVDPAEPDRVLGYVQSEEWDAHEEATGERQLWVARVGTRRSHRGRGIAATLLEHVLHLGKSEGFDVAGLDVDSENPTGALGVYERAGFTPVLRKVKYAIRG